jgi:hypothetical protein
VSEILVNRAPFLTLWASIVAGRLGYDADEALVLGRAVAGQTAASKGKRLGILEERSAEDRRELETRREVLGAEAIHFMTRTTPCLRTPQGLRAWPRPHRSTRTASAATSNRKSRMRFRSSDRDSLRLHGPIRRRNSKRMPWTSTCDASRGCRGKAGWGQRGCLDVEAIDRLLAERV